MTKLIISNLDIVRNTKNDNKKKTIIRNFIFHLLTDIFQRQTPLTFDKERKERRRIKLKRRCKMVNSPCIVYSFHFLTIPVVTGYLLLWHLEHIQVLVWGEKEAQALHTPRAQEVQTSLLRYRREKGRWQQVQTTRDSLSSSAASLLLSGSDRSVWQLWIILMEISNKRNSFLPWFLVANGNSIISVRHWVSHSLTHITL